jgi:hypothetical protein
MFPGVVSSSGLDGEYGLCRRPTAPYTAREKLWIEKDNAMKTAARRHAILGGAAILILATLSYTHFFLLRSAGSGPAGPAVPLAPFESIWTENPVLLLGLGDSITAGYGATDGKSYFSRLVENPGDEFDDMAGRNLSSVFPNLTIRNLSVSGSTSLDHAEDQIPAIELQPEETLGLVVFTTGGNDLIHMTAAVSATSISSQ